jgi:hypothetical protein
MVVSAAATDNTSARLADRTEIIAIASTAERGDKQQPAEGAARVFAVNAIRPRSGDSAKDFRTTPP